ncbi:DUF4870 domain-containing protein [Thermaerobacillus caldiproteolyticus]|uniref:DUF4870 domain-containing protein n=1 Tax=Thermaerobacillus caldiproteolyticus TaxID=247480 RepID=UPI00188ABB09|nr:DUF4870 domain-containing protein [Anoxybacillus caldiproteolyticus]QPA30656.1 DUF4870 domain-containing protein [Anoxybacillus caldiproteolyticus]
MNSNKVLASLCYFSVFFAGFIFPIIVYFVSDRVEVKTHAKKAFLSHLIPFATIVLFVIMGISIGIFHQGGAVDAMPGLVLIGIIIAGIVNMIVVVWNIIKGIQVLK